MLLTWLSLTAIFALLFAPCNKLQRITSKQEYKSTYAQAKKKH